MPWWFLALSACGLLLTLNAIRPVRRLPPLVVQSFFAGWWTSEAPLHHLLGQLLGAALLVYWGALGAWPGWLGLGLCLVSWTGLLWLQGQAGGAEEVLEDALRQALGPDYRRVIQGRHELDAPLPPGRLLLPLWLVDPRVQVTRDLRYAEGAGRRHLLDVYAPRGGVRGAPVLLQIHGGAWAIGHKAQQALPLLYYMAARGWVCVSINYRLSPRARFPEHLIDVKRALAWTKQHIAAYGGDPGFVMATGGSAGGHLCAMLALTANAPEYQPGFERVDTAVQAAVPFYGVYDFLNRAGTQQNAALRLFLERLVLQRPLRRDPELYDRSSPLGRVHPDAPPFFVLHGRNDSLAAVEEARLFVRSLRQVSRAPVAYAELPAAQHAFEVFYSLRTLHVVRAVHRFGCFVWETGRAARVSAAPSGARGEAPGS